MDYFSASSFTEQVLSSKKPLQTSVKALTSTFSMHMHFTSFIKFHFSIYIKIPLSCIIFFKKIRKQRKYLPMTQFSSPVAQCFEKINDKQLSWALLKHHWQQNLHSIWKSIPLIGMQNGYWTEFSGMFIGLQAASVADTAVFCVIEITANNWMNTVKHGILS